jgi:hypothetical protein
MTKQKSERKTKNDKSLLESAQDGSFPKLNMSAGSMFFRGKEENMLKAEGGGVSRALRQTE